MQYRVLTELLSKQMFDWVIKPVFKCYVHTVYDKVYTETLQYTKYLSCSHSSMTKITFNTQIFLVYRKRTFSDSLEIRVQLNIKSTSLPALLKVSDLHYDSILLSSLECCACYIKFFRYFNYAMIHVIHCYLDKKVNSKLS